MIARPNSNLLQTLRTHRQKLMFAVLGILAPLLVFAAIAEDLLKHEAFLWDRSLLETIHAQATPALDRIMLVITHAGDVRTLSGVIALALLGLWFRGFPQQATFLALSSGGAAIMNVGLKLLFQRSRPELWARLIPEHDFGFPSGHAMGSTAVAMALIVLVWQTRWRYPVLLLGLGFTLAVGFSRLYLGVHYPSDVIAGGVLSIAWVTVMALWLRPEAIESKPEVHA